MNIYSIYKATNLITGKSYIGFDSHYPKRRAEHKSAANRDNGNNKFYNAIKKYSWDSFIWEVIYQSVDGAHCLSVMEQHFINEYNSVADGYNTSGGGRGGLGNHWFNNGIIQVFSPICPDETFVSGRLPFDNVGARVGAEKQRGKFWVNNGTHEMMILPTEDIPDGYSVGRVKSPKKNKPNLCTAGTKWWNNGTKSTMARECPGPEWTRGRL